MISDLSRSDGDRGTHGHGRRTPPASNVPTIIWAVILIFAAVHLLRTQVLGTLADADLLLDFSFIPGCYGDLDEVCLLRSEGADAWSPLTYAFLHGDWMHLGANAIWLLAFGTPVVRRLGKGRFSTFCAVGSAAGALLYYVFHPDLIAPVIGASGIVSALMGGACRFAFGAGRHGPLDPATLHRRLLPIRESLANRTVLVFVVVFFATNLFVGSGVGGAFGAGNVAWEAHLGGFAFGFLCFSLFDRRS